MMKCIARNLTLAALLLAATLPARAEITYPVDVSGTAGQWAIWDTQATPEHPTGQVFRRGVSWPVGDGGPIPSLDPRYVYLRMSRVEPPAIDSRLQSIDYPCPEVATPAAHTLVTTCAATVRPAADLLSATENTAQERVTVALTRLGLRDPADQVRAIALLQQARRGAVLSAAQETWLDGVGDAGIEYIDQVRAVQAEIGAWIEEHPGAIPDLGEAVWPPLPTVEPPQ